jgi:hypothetical protein
LGRRAGSEIDRRTKASNEAANYTYRAWDLGPTRFLGMAWLIIGVPLAAWLTWKGRVGWAGLAMSPYVPPVYLMLLLFELRPALQSRASRP